jgi:hypothetical protein
MDDKLPHKGTPDGELPEPSAFRSRREVRIELKGPLGCLAGTIVLALVLVILLIAAIAGLVAVAIVFWVGAAFVAIAIIAALIRGRIR